MPRKAILDGPGALHHIIVRGIERRKIFREDTDRDDFLKRLGGILCNSQTRCFTWALKSNHFHLLLRTRLVPISNVMRRLLTGYVVSFNLKHRRSRRLFQNLGDGDFVETVLGASNERLDRRCMLQAMGYDFGRRVERVATLFEIPSHEVLRVGRYARTVAALSVLCYWESREVGIRTVELARRLQLAQSTASRSVERGEKIVAEKQLLMFFDVK